MDGDVRPYGVGFYFSLGHSSVVFALTLAIALAARWVTRELPVVKELGGYVGTTVSGVFLYAIGIANLLVLIDVFRVFRASRRGEYRRPGARSAALAARVDESMVPGSLSCGDASTPHVLGRVAVRAGV